MSDANTRGGPIQGKVIGHYLGIFHGCPVQHFQNIAAVAPFQLCNLLILAFLGMRQRDDGAWIPVLTDGRDGCFNGGRAKAATPTTIGSSSWSRRRERPTPASRS